MVGRVSNDRIAAAHELIRAGIEMMREEELTPSSAVDARVQITELSELATMIDAVEVDSLDAIAESGVFSSFGHTSAKVMVRHDAKLSNAEALGREQTRRALAGLPEIAAEYRRGKLGKCQMRCIARVWANKRVRELLEQSQAHFLVRAQSLPYKQFQAYASGWERRADEDGTIDQTERDHRNRNFDLTENYDGTFTPTGGLGNAQGNRIRTAFDHFIALELEADLTRARLDREDNSDPLVMPRTARQRRADALEAMALAALCTEPGGKEPRWVANTVIDIETLDRTIAQLEGLDVPADDPNRDSYICRTSDGRNLHPTDVARDVLAKISPIRRAVIDARGVVIDLSEQRFFTGSAKLAVQLSHDECYWPGCHVPVSDCQIDHLKPHHRRGRTDPENGGPACGKHNRIKEIGEFTVGRDRDGHVHVRNRHGTTID